MNLNENKYTEFALIKEMLETGEILKNVRIDEIKKLAASLKNQKKVYSFLKKNKPDFIFIAAAKVGGIYSNDKECHFISVTWLV